MTIDYDITVMAFLCVMVPRKTLTFNNKQTTISVTSDYHALSLCSQNHINDNGK